MAKVTGSNKSYIGSARARAGLPAKAGRRRGPINTFARTQSTPEKRARGRFIHDIKKHDPAPKHDQIRLVLTGTQPELERMFAEVARDQG